MASLQIVVVFTGVLTAMCCMKLDGGVPVKIKRWDSPEQLWAVMVSGAEQVGRCSFPLHADTSLLHP